MPAEHRKQRPGARSTRCSSALRRLHAGEPGLHVDRNPQMFRFSGRVWILIPRPQCHSHGIFVWPFESKGVSSNLFLTPAAVLEWQDWAVPKYYLSGNARLRDGPGLQGRRRVGPHMELNGERCFEGHWLQAYCDPPSNWPFHV